MARDEFPVVVHIVLRRPDDGAICLMRRQNTGFLDGYYALPGGHLQAGEQVQQAAARELLEECALRPDQLLPLACLPYRTFKPLSGSANEGTSGVVSQGINLVFEAELGEQQPVINEPEFADDLIWWIPGTKSPRMPAWVAEVAGLSPVGDWYLEFDWPPHDSSSRDR